MYVTLQDPGSAIPLGTLLAIGVTAVSYIGYGFMSGGCFMRRATGNNFTWLKSQIIFTPSWTIDPNNGTINKFTFKVTGVYDLRFQGQNAIPLPLPGNETLLYFLDGKPAPGVEVVNGTYIPPANWTNADYVLSDAYKCDVQGPSACEYGLQFDNQV